MVFKSFFPYPKLFFSSFVLWGGFCLLLWFGVVKGLGPELSLGPHLGVEYPAALAEGADAAAEAEFKKQQDDAVDMWFYQYFPITFILFLLPWMTIRRHPWARWSVLGSALIIFLVWLQVEVFVWLNEWQGDFYNLIQKALSEPGKVGSGELFAAIITLTSVITPLVIVLVLNSFFVSHYVFRWRTAMNNHYVAIWPKVRKVEGASQRIQEDAMKFAAIVESLGVSLLNSVMTLIAFMPVLWELSKHITELPMIGEISQPLIFVAILWSIFGTLLLAAVGIKLPGLQFENQKVEAAYRKELVYGEDHDDRAEPIKLANLYSHVRKNYFRLYFHYCYFNVVRFTYLQLGNLIPVIALIPTIASGTITLGIMTRITSAFNQVENSFQYLINSWTTIVELMSIYKRLKAFEQSIAAQDQPIDLSTA